MLTATRRGPCPGELKGAAGPPWLHAMMADPRQQNHESGRIDRALALAIDSFGSFT